MQLRCVWLGVMIIESALNIYQVHASTHILLKPGGALVVIFSSGFQIRCLSESPRGLIKNSDAPVLMPGPGSTIWSLSSALQF